MKMQKNISLKHYNTFGIDAKAKNFVTIASIEELQNFIQLSDFHNQSKFILGGGSNVLFTGDFDGIVLKNELLGKKIVAENDTTIRIRVGAGENWHQFVLWCLERDYGGIENLSLIPGTVGAAPIQNIGAYGVELKDVFYSLEALDLQTGETLTFDNAACQFGYRDSLFKRQLKGKVFIAYVTLQLTKTNHKLHMRYGAIQKILKANGDLELPAIQGISKAIIQIRSNKLPDPTQLGNAGSFFKNPEIAPDFFSRLAARFPNIVSYPMPNGKIKVPAGWLIEQCGWKGKRIGNTGAYARQALVLVNYGNATGMEVATLANEIRASVQTKFGILLTPEVNMIPVRIEN